VLRSFILLGTLGLALHAQAPLVTGQPDTAARYEAIHATTGGETVTVQQPASPSTVVQFEVGYIYCAAAGTATLIQNAAAATSTKLTTTALNSSPPSQATAWSASNISGGTSLNVYNIAAGGTLTLDLSKLYLGINGGTGQNFSIKVSSACTGSQIMIQWTEH
jgi:hypothetical protein